MSEERVNSITHGVGLLLSIAGAVVLMWSAAGRDDFWHLIGCGLYASTMVAVYAASTLSHVFQQPSLRRMFRILDQGFIYLFIAGTYTPLGLTYLRDGWWPILLGVMWGIAIVGFFSKIILAHRIDAVATILYVLMGWLPVLAVRPLLDVAPPALLWLMLAGGLCYTVGTLFLTLDERIPYFHSIWHVSVIAGSACHYAAIAFYMLPPETA